MIRKRFPLLLIPLILAGCTPPESFVEAFRPGGPPILDSVSVRVAHDPAPVIYADLHFRSADGNVVALHRDILSSDTRYPLSGPSDVVIDIAVAQQQSGAVFTDRWVCGTEHYHAQIRTYLIDSNHHHSNPLDYSVDCSG